MSGSQATIWSNLTIKEIDNHLSQLITRTSILGKRLKYKCAYGRARGSDVTISMVDKKKKIHYLLIEVELYASGAMEDKVKKWANRHSQRPNTTTLVVSLVLQALRNRLVNEFSKDAKVAAMVFSPFFRIFPGSGDGRISDEIKSAITSWIEQRL